MIVNAALTALEREFAPLYARVGRPSIAPEKLLRAMLLQAFYSSRSERQLMERLEFDLLFRWFVGLGIDDPAWDHSVFSKNRERLLEGDIAAKFLAAVLAQPRVTKLLSTEHFSVDGTLIEAWASMKSSKPKDDSNEPPADGGRNTEANFHGQKRSNETHASTTDPDAKLYRKGPGKEARLCFMGHRLMENRSGLLVDTCLTPANGQAERVAALAMIEPRADRPQAITLGADKGYDTEDFVNELRSMRVTPHVARKISGRSSAIDGRTARHGGYAVSQPAHPQADRRGLRLDQDNRVGWAFNFAAAAYNLVRRPFVAAGTDNPFNVDFHEKLQNALRNSPEKIPFAALLQQFGQWQSVLGHPRIKSEDGVLGWDEVGNSTLTANRSNHPSSTIADGGKNAGNYTTYGDATLPDEHGTSLVGIGRGQGFASPGQSETTS